MKPSYFEVQLQYPDRGVASRRYKDIDPKQLCRYLQSALADGQQIVGRAHRAGKTLYVYVTLKAESGCPRCGVRLVKLAKQLEPYGLNSLSVYGYTANPQQATSSCMWQWGYDYESQKESLYEMPEVLRVKLGSAGMHPGDYSRCMLDYLISNPTKTGYQILGKGAAV